jgi:hypothetical protein
MKKTILSLALAACMLLLSVKFNPVVAGGGDKQTTTVYDMVKNSNVIVVLLEEDADYVAKLTKKGKTKDLDTYHRGIKTYNDNIQAVATKFFTVGKSLTFKSLTDIKAMSVEDRQASSFLLYNRSITYATGSKETGMHGCDFYDKNQKTVGKNIDAYREDLTFEWVNDPTYEHEPEYRELTIYPPSAVSRPEPIGNLISNLGDIIPSQGEVAICLMQLQSMLVKMATAPTGSIKEQRQAIRSSMDENKKKSVPVIKQRTLLICQDNLEKGTTDATIKANYAFPYKIVSREDMDKAILNKDSSYCILMACAMYKVPKYPGYASVKYTHNIYNTTDGNLMLQVFSGKAIINGFGMDGYEIINGEGMKELVAEMNK